jgi:aerobic-type carbon monoxide dehydrogenase small subunit (CoxS/CutS family)
MNTARTPAPSDPSTDPYHTHRVELVVNGEPRSVLVEARATLAEVLREHLFLTGTHLGCEHGVCGACTVLVDGQPTRACLVFGVQLAGAEVITVEGLTPSNGLSDLQEAFRAKHGLQCGFCTPGFVVTAHAFLERNPNPTRAEIRAGISGNLCRCTGYQGIVDAVELTARNRGAQVGIPSDAVDAERRTE